MKVKSYGNLIKVIVNKNDSGSAYINGTSINIKNNIVKIKFNGEYSKSYDFKLTNMILYIDNCKKTVVQEDMFKSMSLFKKIIWWFK